MADLLLQGDGASRLADAALRANGGRAVSLRMPAAAAADDDAEQLGLVTPEFQDVELVPVMFRKAGSTAEMLVSASAVNAVMGTANADSAESLFQSAAGVVVDGVLFVVKGSVAEQAGGAAYAYRVSLRAPGW